MKKILLIFSILIINIGCSKDSNNVKTNSQSMNTVPLNKQITYAIDITAPIPVIIYFNDIKISEENTPLNSTLDVNGYALKNGKYKIKIQIFPIFRRGDKMINPEDIKGCLLKFGSYVRDKEKNDILNYQMNTDLSIKIPTQPVPYFEQEWEVEVKDLPYVLEGWSKGQDLSKIKKEDLEKKVLSFHQKIREVLNNGEADKWLEYTKKRFDETAVFYYNTDDQYNNALQQNKENVTKYCKEMMIPLEDYEMKLYANGKLVTLERKTHTNEFNNKSPLDIKGWGALIRKGQKSGAADYRILLYLPQGSNDFVIIRK